MITILFIYKSTSINRKLFILYYILKLLIFARFIDYIFKYLFSYNLH